MFDIKKDYVRSLPHYEEALTIKNAISGLSSTESMSLFNQANPDENEALVLKSLRKEHELPLINKATLSASVTRQKIAAVYVKVSGFDSDMGGVTWIETETLTVCTMSGTILAAKEVRLRSLPFLSCFENS